MELISGNGNLSLNLLLRLRMKTSIIDYICVSSSIVQSIINHDVVSSAYNFLDHKPVEIKLNISLTSGTGVHSGDVDRPNNNTGYAHTSRSAVGRSNVNNFYDYKEY